MLRSVMQVCTQSFWLAGEQTHKKIYSIPSIPRELGLDRKLFALQSRKTREIYHENKWCLLQALLREEWHCHGGVLTLRISRSSMGRKDATHLGRSQAEGNRRQLWPVNCASCPPLAAPTRHSRHSQGKYFAFPHLTSSHPLLPPTHPYVGRVL